MAQRSFLVTWLLAFAGCAILVVAAYGLTLSAGRDQAPLSSLLWPGVGLYTLLNGSLLFGGGFGALGSFLVITLGAALPWSLVVALLVFAWGRRSKVRQR